MWIVYTEFHTYNGLERWYYGKYATEDRANEVALELGGSWPSFHCVCNESEAESLKILNMP